MGYKELNLSQLLINMNHVFIKGFLDKLSQKEIIEYVNTINRKITLTDHHLKHLISKINGSSYMYNIGKTELTDRITRYQSGGEVMEDDLPEVFHSLIDRISKELKLPKEHAFLQIVDMNNGGSIGKHYDSSFKGFINYKCNISVLSEDYDFCIDDETVGVKETDMYCFEASLYKHWTLNPFKSRRILLSFGFMVPYSKLGRTEEDPRVRLSNRIEKYFQY
jgi:hypothetical protein